LRASKGRLASRRPVAAWARTGSNVGFAPGKSSGNGLGFSPAKTDHRANPPYLESHCIPPPSDLPPQTPFRVPHPRNPSPPPAPRPGHGLRPAAVSKHNNSCYRKTRNSIISTQISRHFPAFSRSATAFHVIFPLFRVPLPRSRAENSRKHLNPNRLHQLLLQHIFSVFSSPLNT